MDPVTTLSRQRALARGVVLTLFVTQCFGSAAIVATATVNALAGRQLTGSDALATLPESVYQLGIAAAAFGWGFGFDHFGWRRGLSLGLALGAAGALLAAAAIAAGTMGAFLAGLILIGMASSALRLARFAAAEAYPPHERGRAVSNVVLGGAAGPLIWAALSRGLSPRMQRLQVNDLTWPYLASLGLFVTAAAVVLGWLRTDPRQLGRTLELVKDEGPIPPRVTDSARSLRQIMRQPAVVVAMTAMIIGQAVMVLLMAISPLHMRGHHHTLADISLALSAHVFGMYALSFLPGRLSDRLGPGPVIGAGAALLALSCLLAAGSPASGALSLALLVLGLGWNFCYVGGSSLLAGQLLPGERPRAQGLNDLLIGAVSAAGSLGGGLLYAGVGYRATGLIGAGAAGVVLLLDVWWQARQRGRTRGLPAPRPEPARHPLSSPLPKVDSGGWE